MKPVQLLILTSFFSGCHLFFGSDPPPECRLDEDCLDRQICERETCVSGTRVVDARVKDAEVERDVELDVALPDLDVPDALLDATPDVLPDVMVDGTPPDAGPAEAFPGGRCFLRESDVWISVPAGATHVPRGICTPWAVVWTEGRPGGAQLRIQRAAEGPAEDGPLILPESPLATDGRFLVFLGPWPGPDDLPRALRLDLVGGLPQPLSASALQNRDPARGEGVSAHIELGPEESWVVLTFDDDSFLSCRRPGTRQWGVALSGGRVGWFETPTNGGRTALVTTDGRACEPRVVRPLDGQMGEETRLSAAGGGFFWIERSREGAAVLAGLRPDARNRLRPLQLLGEGAPVELAGAGGHLAVVRYQPGRYVLDLVTVSTGEARAVSMVSARHPQLANGWLMWAQAATFVPWELRYVDLATIR